MAKSEKDKVCHQPHGSPQELLSFVISCFGYAQTTYLFFHILVRKRVMCFGCLLTEMSRNVDFYFSFGYFSLRLDPLNLGVIVWQKAGSEILGAS